MAFGVLSLKGRALRCLSQREHSRRELERKLARHAQDTPQASAAAQIAAALDELAAHGLLSDERAAASVLAVHGARSGALRLKQQLQAKGLPPELVAQTLQQARSTELERAQALWQRRFGSAPQAAGPAERARQMRFLSNRGFDGDTVRRVVQRSDED